jgi:hypothetical protein
VVSGHIIIRSRKGSLNRERHSGWLDAILQVWAGFLLIDSKCMGLLSPNCVICIRVVEIHIASATSNKWRLGKPMIPCSRRCT